MLSEIFNSDVNLKKKCSGVNTEKLHVKFLFQYPRNTETHNPKKVEHHWNKTEIFGDYV